MSKNYKTPISIRRSFVFFILTFLCGCAGVKTRNDITSQSIRPQTSAQSAEQSNKKKDPFEQPVVTKTTLNPKIVKSPKVNQVEKPIIEKKRIPVVINAHVEKWIKYFTVKDRARFQRFLDRGQRYRDVVETVLEENDLPAELYYLAMIESGYQVEAHSHAKAKGVWQFIPGTADRYGLRVDGFVDERQDPIRSTEAAAKYLRDLYNVFGSWPLAMAGYNAGEIRVLRAVFKGKTRDFWKLVEKKSLPKETSEYVPKFLAVVLIGMNPQKYGFTDPSMKTSYPSVESVEVPGSLTMAEISKVSRIPLRQLQEVNPHISRRTPPGNYELWVPSTYVRTMKQSHGRLASLARTSLRQTASVKPSSKAPYHVVRRGENLTTISKKYKISVGHLKRMNKLKNSQIYVGRKLIVHPKAYHPSKVVRYIVKRGDNLTFIAKKFKTTVTHLRSINKLKKNKLLVGQTLKLVSYSL